MPKKPETRFKEKVGKDLKTLVNTWFVKIQQVAIRGIPDFLLCINGTFIAIELKAKEESPRNPLQEWTLEVIASCGGLSYLCYPANWDVTFEHLKEMAEDSPERFSVKHPN